MSSRLSLQPAVVFLLLTLLIDTIGLGIIIPVVPKLIMTVGQTDIAHATRIGGWLFVVYAGLQFLCGPFFGNLSDRFGRRPVIMLSLACFSLDYLVAAFAPTLMWLFIGRAIAGLAGAVNAPVLASLADITPPEKRAGAFGLAGAAFGIGFIVGPSIGGFLGELGPRAPFFAASAMAALNLVFGFFVLHETLPREKRRSFSLARANPVGAVLALRHFPTLLVLAGSFLLWLTACQVYAATWSFYGIARFNWSPSMIGASLAVSGLVMVIVQGGVTGRVIPRFGEYRSAMVGLFAGALCFIAFSIATKEWMVFAILLISAPQALVYPSLNGAMSKMVGPSQQGEIQGVASSLNSLAAIVGPIAMTEVFARFTSADAPIVFPGAAFVLAAILTVATLFLLAYGRHQSPQKVVESEASSESKATF